MLHERRLLAFIGIVLLGWTILLPSSVVQRIQMTTTKSGNLESSASKRVDLWDNAIEAFLDNPIIGIGYNGFQLTMESEEERLTDTHNYYLKALSEGGLIGIILLIAVLLTALQRGWRLFQIGSSPFYRGMGLGFLGTAISLIVTNGFGDRWTYLELGSYFWIMWGMVDRGIVISESEELEPTPEEVTSEEPEEIEDETPEPEIEPEPEPDPEEAGFTPI